MRENVECAPDFLECFIESSGNVIVKIGVRGLRDASTASVSDRFVGRITAQERRHRRCWGCLRERSAYVSDLEVEVCGGYQVRTT